ncbi:MAG: hypothetical protein ACFFEK_14325 [Candidatus Thorarchaeota archaeon]
MVDEFEEHAVHPDDRSETSHPDIDSALEMHLGPDDFSYKTRTMNGTTEHLVMRLKKEKWKIHLRIDDEEITNFEPEEIATYIILQVKLDKSMKKRFLIIFLLLIVMTLSITYFSFTVLGIGVNDDFRKFLIFGGIIGAFIPLACILTRGAEHSVDKALYASRPDFIQVLQKMMEQKESPYEKRSLQNRINRLQPLELDTQ